MRILIRADASTMLGTGHVMRTLALAQRLAENGAAIRFATRSRPGDLAPLIRAQGFPVTLLAAAGDVPYPEWQDADWLRDAELMSTECGEDAPFDWLLVDAYAFDARWQRALRTITRRVAVIDDLANRPHDCDVLIDQNLHAGDLSRYAPLLPADCVRLLGPRYALLRPEFRAARESLRPRDGEVRRILVLFGGAAPVELTVISLEALRSLGRADIAVDVVAGSEPVPAALRAAAHGMPGVTLHGHVTDVPALMNAADIAIGAAGSTAWERCCLGLPAIVVTLAVNQEPIARALAAAGCALYVGRAADTTREHLLAALKSLLGNPTALRSMARAAAVLADGRGTLRVARMLDSTELELRAAAQEDSAQVYQWRNAEDTRRHSHDPSPICPDAHAAWFARVLENDECDLLIAESAGAPVGVLRYDVTGGECTVSIYLVPGCNGRGLGARLLCAGHAWLRRHRPEVRSVRAEVLADNLRSIHAFLEAGYSPDGDVYTRPLYP